MTRRQVIRQAALFGCALVCLALAAGLGLLAADIVRWRDALPAGDVRYQASPEDGDLWQSSTLLPLGVVDGVLGLARLVSETQERAALLQATIASLQLAIALDPSNDEAKFNLELAYQRGRGIQLTEGAGGPNPSPGGSGAKGAGAGEAGSGY